MKSFLIALSTGAITLILTWCIAVFSLDVRGEVNKAIDEKCVTKAQISDEVKKHSTWTEDDRKNLSSLTISVAKLETKLDDLIRHLDREERNKVANAEPD